LPCRFLLACLQPSLILFYLHHYPLP
jgi:hypothetical protein